MAAPFRLYNTLTRSIEPFTPITDGNVSLYVCGMTVYDHIHVGHARAMVVFDTVVRYLRYRGWSVRFIRNFTDIDDKIIHRAAETGEEPLALAQRFIDAFHKDTDALGLMRPDSEPRVSDSIEEIHEMIQSLLDQGHAYINEGTVWFAVSTFEEYGKLSGQNVDELKSADEVAGKRAGADFALWKAVKPGEPSWASPWGPGRPGWHIECSAMAKKDLGTTIDIHGGGLDLVFPHHENEVAQSECAHKSPYVRYWMHNGLLTMTGGQKMGKSLGNVINVHKALEEYPAEALRIYYLQNHYRSPLPWSGESLQEALAMLSRLYDAKELAESLKGQEDADQVAKQMGDEAEHTLQLGRSFEEKFLNAMDADFNTSQALGHLYELARAINRFGRVKKAKKRGGPVVRPALNAFALVADAIGLVVSTPEAFQEEVKRKRTKAMNIDPEDIEHLITQRSEARAAKNWDKADEIRAQLESMHIAVMDTPDGVEWRFSFS